MTFNLSVLMTKIPSQFKSNFLSNKLISYSISSQSKNYFIFQILYKKNDSNQMINKSGSPLSCDKKE